MIKFYWDYEDIIDFVKTSDKEKEDGIGKLITEEKVITFCQQFVNQGACYGFCCINTVEDNCMLFNRNSNSELKSTQETDTLLVDFVRYAFSRYMERAGIENSMIIEIIRSPNHSRETYVVGIYFGTYEFKRKADHAHAEYLNTYTPEFLRNIGVKEIGPANPPERIEGYRDEEAKA